MFSYFSSLLDIRQIDPVTDFVASFIIHNGIFAPILLLLLEEAGIPLPIPGDIYVAYTGYLVSKGRIPYWLAFVLLVGAVLIGASILYYFSSKYGHSIVVRYGKYIHLNEKKLDTVEKKFKKYGVWVIIFGRHVPGFRIPITVFSGISGVSYRTFILSTFVSVVFWILLYLSAGERLGKRILRLFHGHDLYFVLFFIPFIIFVGSILYIRFVKKEDKKK